MVKFILKTLVLSLLIIFGILSFNKESNTYYNAIKVYDSPNKYSVCDISDEYLKWYNLSPKLKEKTYMPQICENTTNYKTSNLKKYSLSEELSFDLRNYNEKSYVTPIKDQQNTGSCWAFSALGSLESYLLYKGSDAYDFSERHMEYSTSRYFLNGEINPYGFNRYVGDGGNIYLASSYYFNGNGPILESDMPFENNEDTIQLSSIQNKTQVIDVNAIKNVSSQTGSCNATSMQNIKESIVTNGAVETGMYMTESSFYYNSTTGAYYYNGTGYINHGVIIVGWNDNYSKDLFSDLNKPSIDGAWIVKNSYGTSFGDNGYIYVSYSDNFICNDTYAYLDVDNEVEDNTYYYDEVGYNVGWGYTGYNYIYAANKFTKGDSRELLKEVSIGLIEPLNYELYVNSVNSDLTGSNVKLIKSGSFDYNGYGTIKLDEPIVLDNDSFAIIVKYQLPSGGDTPLAVQVRIEDGGLYNYASYVPEKSYTSLDLINWTDLSTLSVTAGSLTLQYPIASIKAYTDSYSVDISSLTYSINGSFIKGVSTDTTYSDMLSNLTINASYTVTLKDKNGLVVTGGDVVMGTGMSLVVNDGTYETEYKIIIYGDTTGDGRINISDVAKLYQHIKGTNIMNESYYIMASDVVGDTILKLTDVAKLYQYVKGTITEL